MLPVAPIFGLALVFRERKSGTLVFLLSSLFEVKPNNRGRPPGHVCSALPGAPHTLWGLGCSVRCRTPQLLGGSGFRKAKLDFLFHHFLRRNPGQISLTFSSLSEQKRLPHRLSKTKEKAHGLGHRLCLTHATSSVNDTC